MLHGDREAMTRLHAAGARQERVVPATNFAPAMQALAHTVKKGVPMIKVTDVANSLDWYVALGFKEVARFDDDGLVNFGMQRSPTRRDRLRCSRASTGPGGCMSTTRSSHSGSQTAGGPGGIRQAIGTDRPPLVTCCSSSSCSCSSTVPSYLLHGRPVLSEPSR